MELKRRIEILAPDGRWDGDVYLKEHEDVPLPYGLRILPDLETAEPVVRLATGELHPAGDPAGPARLRDALQQAKATAFKLG